MSNFAQLTMAGRLGRDPELRYVASGTAIAEFSVASTRKFGDNREETFWANVAAWGKLAELIADNYVKGDQIIFTARCKTDSWEDQEGNKRSKPVFTIERMLAWTGSKEGSESSVEEGQEIPY